MRSLLGAVSQALVTAAATYVFLGKHLRPRTAPAPAPPFGFLQAFYACNRCAAIRAHFVHGPFCRTCQTCEHTTYPGDPQ